MMYAVLRVLMRTLTRAYWSVFQSRRGRECPAKGPIDICPNHSATLDPRWFLRSCRDDTWSMAKFEYFRKPLMAFWFHAYQAFPVVRHSADRTALRRSFDLLKAGHALIMYPEGTRIESGVLAKPEPGAGFIAQKAACPVLPVGLTGTRECFPKGARWPRRTRVSITFGKPFMVLQKRADGTRVSHEDASDAIMVAIAELLPPEQRGEFSDWIHTESASL